MAELLSFPQGHSVYTVPSPFCHRVRETSVSQTRGQGRHFLDKCTWTRNAVFGQPHIHNQLHGKLKQHMIIKNIKWKLITFIQCLLTLSMSATSFQLPVWWQQLPSLLTVFMPSSVIAVAILLSAVSFDHVCMSVGPCIGT